MQPTTEKITVSQSDYNNLADWAKPSYQVQTQTAPTLNQTNNQIQQTQPPAGLAITPQSLQQTPQIKIPSIKNTDTTSAGIVASTQPSVQTAQENYNQVQQATGTQAQEAQSALQRMAENIFGQKADAQSNQVNLENLAGIQEQQKALGEINTSIASEQVALRGEQEKVRQGYATEQQKQISNNTLNDTYGRRLADLAIRQSAANQNITAIQTNAERQTKLLTAPLDTKILYLSTFGKDNVDFLTKEQQNKLAFISDDLKSQKQDITALQTAKTAMITEIAQNGGGTNQALIKQIQDAKDIGSVATLGASSGFVGKLDRNLKQAQIGKIYADMANDRLANQSGLKGDNLGNLQAYANEFSQTGKIPSPTDLAKAGVTVSQVTQYAKQLPKPSGAIVSTQTGVTPSNLSATQLDGISALRDISLKTQQLKMLEEKRIKGVTSAIVGKTFGSNTQQEYIDLRGEIVDLLARARTGAALTKDEEDFYASQLPGRVGQVGFGLFGTNTQKRIDNFESKINSSLDTKLKSSDISMYGYSKTKIGDNEYTVGDILDVGGTQYRVLSDGTLTDVIQ